MNLLSMRTAYARIVTVGTLELRAYPEVCCPARSSEPVYRTSNLLSSIILVFCEHNIRLLLRKN